MFTYTTAFASFSTNDINQAKDFYGTILGIPIESHMPGMMTLQIGAGVVNVFEREHFIAGVFTVLNFEVDNMAEAQRALTDKGVVFEHYTNDEGITTDEQGVMEFMGVKAAWFKDPAGNLLQLIQQPVSD